MVKDQQLIFTRVWKIMNLKKYKIAIYEGLLKKGIKKTGKLLKSPNTQIFTKKEDFCWVKRGTKNH